MNEWKRAVSVYPRGEVAVGFGVGEEFVELGVGVVAAETGIAAVVFGIHNVAPTHGAATMVADADMVDVEGVEYIWVLPLADEPPGHLLRLGIDRLTLGLMENGTKLWALCEF